MNKRQTSIKNLSKIQLPGIIILELLELQELLPELKLNLIKSIYCVTLLGQIRISLSIHVPPSEVLRLESVNNYIKRFISKSEFTSYIAAATAIRKTMAVYVNDSDSQKIIADHCDLCNNLYGPSSTKGGSFNAIQTPERLRKYRRGIMLQIISKFQSVPIYTPLKISRDIDHIGPEEFISYLPFEVDENKFTLSDIIMELQTLLYTKEFSDLYMPNKDILLEIPLDISRTQTQIPDLPFIKEDDLKSLPAWKKAALSQSKNFNRKLNLID